MLGKASLAESFGLPSPQSPSRGAFPGGKSLLKFHGFDSTFDQQIARVADTIIAEEAPLDKWLKPALDSIKARRELARLPCAHVILTKPLSAEALAAEAPAPPAKDAAAQAMEAKKTAAAAQALTEAHDVVAELLAGAVARFGVQAGDLTISRVDGRLTCVVRLLGLGASMVSVLEALQAAANDKKGFVELQEAFVEAGASPEAPASVVAKWPLERAREQVRLAFPQYELPLEMLLARLPQIVSASWKACAAAWESAGGEAPADLDALLEIESLAMFGGDLLTAGEAAKRGLLLPDLLRQGTTDLEDLVSDAVRAQRQLKQALAEGSPWAAAALNDEASAAPGSEERSWLSAASAVVPNAHHYDPGVKHTHRVFEKAKGLQRGYEATPPFDEVMDVSRLALTFATARDAAEGVRRLLELFKVVWMDNRFRNPESLGYRYMTLGVQSEVPVRMQDPETGSFSVTMRTHISEIVVRLQDLHEARRLSEATCRSDVGAALAGCGVLPQHVDRSSSLLLSALACTDGSLRRTAMAELTHCVSHYVRYVGKLTAEGGQVAESIADELGSQAISSGVEFETVASILEDVPYLNEKRALGARRTAVVDSMIECLTSFSGVDFEDFLGCLLADITKLPKDVCGRVCLSKEWWTIPQFAATHPSWRGVLPAGELRWQLRVEDMRAEIEAVNAHERILLGRVTDLRTELAAVTARSSARALGEALIRFLLARSMERPLQTQELAAAVQWATKTAAVTEDTLATVSRFLRWAAFEDDIIKALGEVPSPAFMAALRAALVGDGAPLEHVLCLMHWQTTGIPYVCGRLSEREPRALPVACVLLELGTAEVRGQVAEAMAGPDGTGEAWPSQVVASGALPLLANLLHCARSEGRCSYFGTVAVRYFSSCEVSRAATSEAGVIDRLAALVLDEKLGGQDVSFNALTALNHLAKGSEADAEAIRGTGLQVDGVGRVKKKKS